MTGVIKVWPVSHACQFISPINYSLQLYLPETIEFTQLQTNISYYIASIATTYILQLLVPIPDSETIYSSYISKFTCHRYPPGKLTQLQKMTIFEFIVDIPIKNGDFPQLCKGLPEATSTSRITSLSPGVLREARDAGLHPEPAICSQHGAPDRAEGPAPLTCSSRGKASKKWCEHLKFGDLL